MKVAFKMPTAQKLVANIKGVFKFDVLKNAWFDSVHYDKGEFKWIRGDLQWTYISTDWGEPKQFTVFANWILMADGSIDIVPIEYHLDNDFVNDPETAAARVERLVKYHNDNGKLFIGTGK